MTFLIEAGSPVRLPIVVLAPRARTIYAGDVAGVVPGGRRDGARRQLNLRGRNLAIDELGTGARIRTPVPWLRSGSSEIGDVGNWRFS